MEDYVYLCYSTKDSKIAGQICRILEQNGLKCWFQQRDIDTSLDIALIDDAIKESQIVLFICSQNSLTSDSAKRQIELSFMLSKQIISFPIDETLPFAEWEFYLKNSFFIDSKLDDAEKVKSLIEAIASIIESENISSAAVFKPKYNIIGLENLLLVGDGMTNDHSYFYLSYDNVDYDRIDMYLSQFGIMGYELRLNNPEEIENSYCMVVFISKDSNKSKTLQEDFKKAIKYKKHIIPIYLDDVEINFGRMFKLRFASKLKDLIKVPINKFEMSEKLFIDRCREIFNLYGIDDYVSETRPNSFASLEKLLQSSSQVSFESDYVLGENEKSEYGEGIVINTDELKIDGAGYGMTCDGIKNVFNITCGKVILKNFDFTGMMLEDMASIIRVGENASLKIMECRFASNSFKNSHAVLNHGRIEIINSSFNDNISENEGLLIKSLGDINCINCDFSENNLDSFLMSNEGNASISNCRFYANRSEVLIKNHDNAFLNASNSLFAKNSVDVDLIFNHGRAIIERVKFEDNTPEFTNISCTVESVQTIGLHKPIMQTTAKKTQNKFFYLIYDDADIEEVKPYIDEYSKNGLDFKTNDLEKITDSQFALLFVSKYSYNSDKITFEMQMAMIKGVEVVPMFLDSESESKFKSSTSMFIGKFKSGIDLKGIIKRLDSEPYVYLLYDDADKDSVENRISQFRSMGFKCGRENIENASLVCAFVSQKSSGLNLEGIDRDIILIRMDNAVVTGAKPTYEINMFELTEKEYIQKCREIFNLYGICPKDESDEDNTYEIPHFSAESTLNFEDFNNLLKGNDYIALSSDVMFSQDSSDFGGIELDVDGLTIDGCGHTINAEGIGKIFNVTAKDITLKDLNFRFSRLKEISAIIYVNEDASLSINNCSFESNDLDDGHAIYNWGKISINSSKFIDNHSSNEGSAIYSRNGKVNCINCEFTKNRSGNSGGAILNWAQLDIRDSRFIENSSKGYGGAIGNVIDADLVINSSEFRENSSVGEGCAIYNENSLRIHNSMFDNHKSDLSLIFSENLVKIYGCSFTQNSIQSAIQNCEDGVSDILGSKFIKNNVEISLIYNNGQANVDRAVFRQNSSSIEDAVNILNESYMRLKHPKMDEDNISVLNKGNIDIWKVNPKTIKNLSTVSKMDGPCDKPNSFSHLEDLIEECEDNILELENDITLENCELDFFEGGIELACDNLVIDGCGHYINGAKRSSIFHVTGKNITLKNIIFKNGRLHNPFEPHITGGASIRTVTNSSLKIENCEFVDNVSDDDGGAILNRSELTLQSCRFENNSSKYFGGAVCNKGSLMSYNNEFADNPSRIDQDIFSHRTIVGNMNENNILELEVSEKRSLPYSHLDSMIRNSKVITLDCDIKYDYGVDGHHIGGIQIDDDLTIDGAGHQIDASNKAGLLNITSSEVVFKNIIFKNAHCEMDSAIRNNGNVKFENCRFINNNMSADKSLIYNESSLEIENCMFINNSSKNNPIIANRGTMKLSYTEISLNSHSQSVIGNDSNLSIDSCSFVNNHSLKNAGVLNNRKTGHILARNSRFIKNSALESGGTIVNYGEIMLENLQFDSNFSFGDGGVVRNELDGIMEIKHVKFENNSSRSDGGAIVNWGKIQIKDSKFINNKARKDGGIINIQKGSLRLENSLIFKNNAYDGGSIFNRGLLDIRGCKFEGNAARKDGGVLNTYDGEIRLSCCIFNRNQADEGGAIYSVKNSLQISDCEFLANKANINGGAIINWCDTVIENSKLNDNSSAIYGGAINNQSGILEIFNNRFENNRAYVGGAIFPVEMNKLKMENCQFNDNFPDDVYE